MGRRWVLGVLLACAGACGGDKHVFTTKLTYTGDLGGVAGADSKCALTAKAAGFDGAFIAILSTSTTNAIDRIDDVGPWHLSNGDLAFNNRAGIATTPVTALGSDENGDPIGQRECSWTGSIVGATKAANTCSDWTSASGTTLGQAGNPISNESFWIDGRNDCVPLPCNLMFGRLYCIEQ